MGDYQLRARIPQEMATELFEVIKDIQEETEVGDITISNVTRSAIDDFIKKYNKKTLNIELDNSLLTDKVLDNVSYIINDLVKESYEGKPEGEVLLTILYFLMQEKVDRIKNR